MVVQPHFHSFGASGTGAAREIIIEQEYRRIMVCSKLPLTIDGHADGTGLRVRYQKCGQFVVSGD